MSFIQKQITEKQSWLSAESKYEGTMFFPADMFDREFVANECGIPVEEVEEVEGYGARLSAPGYMDCTEWSVYSTEKKAKDALEEMYGEDEEEEEDEEEDEEDKEDLTPYAPPCDSCSANVIQGVLCHERGCPVHARNCREEKEAN